MFEEQEDCGCDMCREVRATRVKETVVQSPESDPEELRFESVQEILDIAEAVGGTLPPQEDPYQKFLEDLLTDLQNFSGEINMSLSMAEEMVGPSPEATQVRDEIQMVIYTMKNNVHQELSTLG